MENETCILKRTNGLIWLDHKGRAEKAESTKI